MGKVLRAHIFRQKGGNIFRTEAIGDKRVDASLRRRPRTINPKDRCVFSSHGCFLLGSPGQVEAIKAPMIEIVPIAKVSRGPATPFATG
jgi:hypothetical protein